MRNPLPSPPFPPSPHTLHTLSLLFSDLLILLSTFTSRRFLLFRLPLRAYPKAIWKFKLGARLGWKRRPHKSGRRSTVFPLEEKKVNIPPGMNVIEKNECAK